MMNALPVRNKEILIRKIRQCKKRCFPGAGGGTRLASEIGVPPQTVLHWLKGSRTPTFEQLLRLAKTFSVSPLELCGVGEKNTPTRNTADIALLRRLLDVLECTIRNGGSLSAMRSIKNMIAKEIEEIESEKNEKSA